MTETTPTITLKEFAKHLGVSPSYVTALKQAGRLVLDEEGRVFVEASCARIADTAGGNEAVAARHAKRRGRTASDPIGAAAAPDHETPEPVGGRAYWDRRAAAASAELREIELAEKKGTLVQVEAVRRAGVEIGTALRSALENLPDQLAPALVAINDEVKVHALLAEHFQAVLNDISVKLGKLNELRSAPAEAST